MHLDVPYKEKKIPVQIDGMNETENIQRNKIWIVLTHGAGGDFNIPQLAAVARFLINSNYIIFRFTCKGLNIKYRVNVFSEMLVSGLLNLIIVTIVSWCQIQKLCMVYCKI